MKGGPAPGKGIILSELVPIGREREHLQHENNTRISDEGPVTTPALAWVLSTPPHLPSTGAIRHKVEDEK